MKSSLRSTSLALALFSGFTNLATAAAIGKRAAACYDPLPPELEDKKAPGYFVKLVEGYTMQQHFEKIGAIPGAVDLEESGYAAEFSDDQMAKICEDPGVVRITDDAFGEFTIVNSDIASDVESYLRRRKSTPDVGYALAHLSAKQKNPTTPYTYDFIENAGEGVDIYILDTGIADHLPEFEGRVKEGKSYVPDGTFQDTADHGTTVAGCAGSKTYGTSKKANLWNYRVAGSSDALQGSIVVTALQDVIKADKERRKEPNYKGAVVNLSMKLIDDEALENKIMLMHANKIAVVVAAGNDNFEARENPLCRYDDVICVAASNENYERADFSNWGSRVTHFAPGENIRGIHNDGSVTDDNKGTSFSAPYVAGIVATFYGREGKVERREDDTYVNTGFNNDKARMRLDANADRGYLDGSTLRRGSPNIMANNGFNKDSNGYIGAPPAPPACNNNNRRDDQEPNPACQTTIAEDPAAPTVNGAAIADAIVSAVNLGDDPSRITQSAATATQGGNEGGPTTTVPQPTRVGELFCWPTNDVEKPFPTNIASPAIDDFNAGCKNPLERSEEADKRSGCILAQQPAQSVGADDQGVEDLPWMNLSVEQIWWAEGQKKFNGVGGEISYVMRAIMSNCQTNNADSMTIGGWTITGSEDTGYRQWNLTGLAERMDTPPGFVVGGL